eukprot:6190856-Pleurochrysis_carterae.AAC.1
MCAMSDIEESAARARRATIRMRRRAEIRMPSTTCGTEWRYRRHSKQNSSLKNRYRRHSGGRKRKQGSGATDLARLLSKTCYSRRHGSIG